MDTNPTQPTAVAERVRRDRSPRPLDGDRRRLRALIVLGVARLETVSASLGSEAGEALLVTLTARLGATIGSAGTLARIGGDEFAIRCDEPCDKDQAVSLAGQLIEAVTPMIVVGGLELFLTARAGVAFARPAVATSRLLTNASSALEQARLWPHDAVAVCDLSGSGVG
jgi:GGDEF domain-containing protein